MKILFVAMLGSVHTQRWVSYFGNRGYDVSLITFYPSDDVKNVKIHYLPVLNKNLAIFKVNEVKKIINSIQPDIMHAHYATSCGLVATYTNFHPYILSTWGDDIFHFPNKSPIHRWAVKKAIRSADYVTSTSQMLAEGTRKIYEPKRGIEVIPFGVDLNRYQYSTRNSKETVTVGTVRILRSKYGVEYLIKAVADVINLGYNVNLRIVGDGPLRVSLTKLTEDLGIEQNVEFTGFVPNDKVVEYMNTFDIFAIPSIGEGETFGVAAVEAMATGLPVIASKIGGLPEVISDGKTGIHTIPRDIQSIKDALLKYINSPELRKEHGLAGRQKVEREYDWNQNAAQMERLYERVLTEKSR